MLILDTDIVTLAHMGNPVIARHIQETRKSEEIAVTIVTKVEILRGRFDHLLKARDKDQFLKAQRLLMQSEAKLHELPIMLLDDAALDVFASLQQKRGTRSIGRADLLIAAIALARDATVATWNVKDFSKVPGLRLANWRD